MSSRTIGDCISQLADTFGKDYATIIVCTVDSVDIDNKVCNCIPVSSEAETIIENVQLSAENNDGILIVPSVGSTVILAYSKYNNPFVLMYEDIDIYQIIVNQTKFLLQDGLTQFNDGSLGGLVKVIDLTTKLNNLENKVNSLVSTFNSHVHSGVTTGGGSSAVTPTPIVGTLTPTNRGDIENNTITHGV